MLIGVYISGLFKTPGGTAKTPRVTGVLRKVQEMKAPNGEQDPREKTQGSIRRHRRRREDAVSEEEMEVEEEREAVRRSAGVTKGPGLSKETVMETAARRRRGAG